MTPRHYAFLSAPQRICGRIGLSSSTSHSSLSYDEFDTSEKVSIQIPAHQNSPFNEGNSHGQARRSFLSLLAFSTVAAKPPFSAPLQSVLSIDVPNIAVANAVETVGKDPNCNDSSCLGVWDGLLADCPHDNIQQGKLFGGGASCVSSQDDTPGVFAEPWDYSDIVPMSQSGGDDAYVKQMDLLILAIQSVSKQHGDNVLVLFEEGRYLRVQFTDGSSGEKSIGEFYFTPSDTTVQFRIGSTSKSSLGFGGRSLSNIERAERIRKSMRYLKVPVLRNRKRSFFFVESDDFDGFGPGSNALGPPEEMSPGEVGVVGEVEAVRTRRGSDDVDPRMKIDFVQEFPFKGF
ncbi:hypothetical protein ACHAXS_006670 [Conticribra weissflogii]